jgi:hypothetical protein
LALKIEDMNDLIPLDNSCCQCDAGSGIAGKPSALNPLVMPQAGGEVCCGPPPGPRSSRHELPGYRLLNFVAAFIDTPVGPVPQVKTRLEKSDLAGTVIARLGIKRDQYKIAPGLYCVGTPDENSPVLVTANYKLSFDALRRELTALKAWILVIDTRGINVWCAAGKAIFSTEEVVQRIGQTRISDLVRHKRLILPQLAATGVSARRVKKQTGFEVLWGPVKAGDIQRYLAKGCKTDKSMRRVTFTLSERIVLVPVELSHLPKPTFWVLLAAFLLSGIGTDIFSFGDAWRRGLMLFSAYLAAVLAGAVAAPVLLPWVPGRAFALKGALTGCIAGLAVAAIFGNNLIWPEGTALVLLTMSASSYLAMNFTGSTPFTSPSGVEKEMRRAIPLQAAAALIAAAAWVTAAFAG